MTDTEQPEHAIDGAENGPEQTRQTEEAEHAAAVREGLAEDDRLEHAIGHENDA